MVDCDHYKSNEELSDGLRLTAFSEISLNKFSKIVATMKSKSSAQERNIWIQTAKSCLNELQYASFFCITTSGFQCNLVLFYIYCEPFAPPNVHIIKALFMAKFYI